MSKQNGSQAESIARDVLAATDYRARRRRLSAHAAECSADLADRFAALSGQSVRSDPGEAAQCARMACWVAHAIGDVPRQVNAMRALAEASVLLGRFRSALRALGRASALAIDHDETALVPDLGLARLYPLIHLERYQEAETTAQEALDLYRGTGQRNGVIRARMGLADLAFRRDRPKDALHHYARVDALIDSATPPRFRAVLAANRANALEARNRFRAAERHFEMARALLADTNFEHSLAQIQYNAAYAAALRGQYADALQGYAATAKIFERLKDERHLALADLERAEIHMRLNLPQEARDLATRAEQRFETLGMKKEAAQSAQITAAGAELLDEHDCAETSLGRAEAGFRDLGLAERRLACLIQRGRIAAKNGRNDDARALAADAEELLDADTAPLSAAAIDALRATVDLAEGDSESALRGVKSALERSRRVHAPWVQIELRRLEGRIHTEREELTEAIFSYQMAVATLESYRGGVPRDEYMAAFLAGRSLLYAEIVQLLVRDGDAELAFEYAERGKSRALVDLLAEQFRSSGMRERNSPFLRRIHHLRSRLNASYQRFFRQEVVAGDLRTSSLACNETNALERELAMALRECRLEDREAVSLETADARDLASVRRSLDADTTLIEYMVTPDTLYAFVITRDSVRVVRHAVADTELRRLLKRFRFHIARFDRLQITDPKAILAATRSNLAQLTEHLLSPLLDDLKARRLVIVPHGCLHGLPFHALPIGRDDWISDHYEVVYAPSAAVYCYCQERGAPASGPACVFGLPDDAVPEIEREVRTVADVLGTDALFLGDEATTARLHQRAPDARILHIATHGMFRREHPMLSSIRMADRWLNLYDLYELDLNAELVVLSTCESGTAGVSDGDEILGLTRGFLYAGTRALLSSQWRVKDSVTATFMETFYRRLEESTDAAAALRATMAEVREKNPHPFYWAPFFLTGHPLTHTRNTEPRVAPVRHLVECP